jgi:HEAT repeat protein
MRGNETAGLKRIIENDPSELDARIEQVRRGLQSDDLQTRRDAGRAFRVAAEQNPAIIEPHCDTLVELLTDRSGSVRLSGVIGFKELATTAPTTVAERIPELLALLEGADAPAIQMAVVRALTRVGEHSPRTIAIADETTADLLRTATPPIKAAIVTVFAGVVVEDPARFPGTVSAIEDALDDEEERVRRYAAAELALIAKADQSAVSSVEEVRERVEVLEDRVMAHPWHSDETIEQAADTFRSLGETDQT